MAAVEQSTVALYVFTCRILWVETADIDFIILIGSKLNNDNYRIGYCKYARALI
jgi:hypothetical protein